MDITFDFEYSDFNETDSIKFTELLKKLSIKINSGLGGFTYEPSLPILEAQSILM